MSLADILPLDLEVVSETASLAGRFGTAQLEDLNITNALQQVIAVDGTPFKGNPFNFF